MPDRAGLNPARLFLAAWPDRATQTRLAEASRLVCGHWGGRPSRPETLHLTLVFIGALARDRIEPLKQAVSGVRSPAFDLTLDRIGCWRHNRIAHLSPSASPAALTGLVSALEGLLDSLSVAFDRRPYAPHVTLARKVACSPSGSSNALQVAPIPWPVRAFDLVESVPTPDGVRYECLVRQRLDGPA